MKHLDHVARGWSADDRGGDDLVHSLVVGWVRRVVDEAGSAGVNGTGEESHTNGALVGDALERADQVGAFQVLGEALVSASERRKRRLRYFYLRLVRPLVFQLI